MKKSSRDRRRLTRFLRSRNKEAIWALPVEYVTVEDIIKRYSWTPEERRQLESLSANSEEPLKEPLTDQHQDKTVHGG